MSNGFDRLERLFTSRRKPSAVCSEASNPVSQPAEPQFPSPSFIRPKATRMMARDEVRLGQANERSPSVPDFASLRLGSSHSRISRSARSQLSTRCPSFSNRRPKLLALGLDEFQFPSPPSGNGQITPISMTFNTLDAPPWPSPRPRSPFQLNILPRLDTPPSSEPDDNGSPVPSSKNTRLASLPYGAPPTPGESPHHGPVPDLLLTGSNAFDLLDKALCNNFGHLLGGSFDKLSLDGSDSEASLVPSGRLSCCSSTLREPDFNDFLNLSDDDIAELAPDSPVLEPQCGSEPSLQFMALSISSAQPLTSLLTLTPPRASRPATAAAFEAARIAKRYDFDLIYIVNLWSGGPRSQILESLAEVPSERPLIGRLLAAHGLHHVPSPLQVSSLVHTSILRSDGWIEYRNSAARPQDLARGYASAFYTGQYTRVGSSETSIPVSGVRLSETINRGIVFAAYRKPRAGDSVLGHSFNKKELDDLRGDAEALVEMIIDIHVANRLRQPPSHYRLSDETGPMPWQELPHLF